MNKMQVEIALMSLVCVLGVAGCASKQDVMQPTSENSAISATSETTSKPPVEVPAETTLSDSLKACLKRISSDSSEGAKMVAEQSCHDNEKLDQGVVGMATTKSRNRASAGTQGDSLEACMASIPADATEGQRMLAEESCKRDQLSHR